MQPESQVLLREFNRRLRAALSGAPNHVRVEAALEVESHVQDVLSRQPGSLPEPERVAQILQGFGTPEEYAEALLCQAPALEVVTVRAGVRDVAVAIGDLLRGSGRLGLAVLRGALRLTIAGVRAFWHYGAVGFELGADLTARTREAGREPAANAVRGLGRLLHKTWSAGETGVSLIRRGAGALFRVLSAVAGGSARTGKAIIRGVGPVIRWLLRTALIVSLSALALVAFGVSIFAAMAPDIAGWWVWLAQQKVADSLDQIRMYTVAGSSPAAQMAFARTGELVQLVTVVVGLLLVLAVGLVIWSGYRRKRQQLG